MAKLQLEYTSPEENKLMLQDILDKIDSLEKALSGIVDSNNKSYPDYMTFQLAYEYIHCWIKPLRRFWKHIHFAIIKLSY
jgi:hypothetical protein